MEYDLGYNITQQLPTAEKVIHFMEKRFDLVLITEMFDESLVMLKEYSCLEMSNFTYLAHNQKESRDKKDYKDFRNKRLQQGKGVKNSIEQNGHFKTRDWNYSFVLFWKCFTNQFHYFWFFL